MKLFGQGLAAVCSAAATLGVAADSASASITFKGIAGINLGMSEAKVDKLLGPPSKVGEESGTVRHDYAKKKLGVLIYKGKVVRVRTTSRSEKTTAGLGPGVKESIVRRRLRGEQCTSVYGTRMCTVDGHKSGLAFVFRRGRVKYVDLVVFGVNPTQPRTVSRTTTSGPTWPLAE